MADTARTNVIEARLRKSGMSEADIKRLRGKKVAVPKKAKKAYSLEDDIKSLGKRGRKKGAKKRAGNKAFREKQDAKKKKKDGGGWVGNLKRNVKMLLKGKNYKVPKNKKKR
jgi:hypothetical protein